MLPSPYTPGESPPVLVGREEQLESARADLGLMATYGRFLGRIRVEIGSRGVGKTSLLKGVRDAAAQAGAVVVWVTARGDESLVAALADAAVRRLDDIGVDAAPRTRLRERLRGLSVELDVGVAGAGVGVDLAPEAQQPVGAAATRFAELVATAATAARERGSAGLVFLVDEVQAAPRADLRTLAYAWQELQVSTPEPPAVVFAVGLPNTPDVLTAAVTFSERFAFRTLRRLGPADAAEVLRGPAAAHDVGWDDDLLAAVVELADGYPYFLQLYGDALWRLARPAAGDVLPAALLDDARDAVSVELDTMFRARWAKATPAERRFLLGMAQLAGDDAPVRRAALAEHLGVSTNDLSVARRSLLDKGLVEVVARGELAFTVPGFAAFVRDEAG